MHLFKLTEHELTSAQLVQKLTALRKHALIDSSHFAVAAVAMIKRPDGQFAYIGGVNVENSEHNRLGMHAEQNAIAAAQSILGEDVKFSKIWVMGAPDAIEPGSTHFLADNHVKPCGHCRQILLSFSAVESEVYSVTVNGVIGEPELLPALLPTAFSERDLDTVVIEGDMPLVQISRLPWLQVSLSDANIRTFCSEIKPHMINPAFQTSSIVACIIKASDHSATQSCYFPGALVQDIAFLTTDALFSSVGQAVTQFGAGFQLQEVHLYASILNPAQLSGSELSHIARFSTASTRIKFHTASESGQFLTLAECVDAYATRLLLGVQASEVAQASLEV